MGKLSKEQISDLLNSIHPKEKEDTLDKYTELLKSLSNNQPVGIDPTLMMLLSSNNGNKSMDKIYEMVAMKQAFKMLSDDEDKPRHNDIDDLIKAIREDTDKKLQVMQDNVSKQIEALKEALPKPKSDESILLEKLIEKMDNANKKGDTDEVDRLIKLIEVMQSNKPAEADPLDTFSKMYGMVNASNERYMDLKEELYKQQNEATQEKLNEAWEIIKQNQNNADWMQELQKSTQTINKFKQFMEDSGLKPAPSKDSGGKVDLKYILDTVSEVVKNVAPNIPPPKQNPSWDIDKEATKLYNKYKTILGQENGQPLSLDFVKQELSKNPNIENIWQQQIKQAYNEQMTTDDTGDIKEPIDSDDEISKLFEEIDNNSDKETPKTKETGETVEKNKSEDNKKDELPPVKKLKGM